MKKIAITTKGPFVGATTLARYLAEKRGFLHISMSEVLIRAYMADRGLAPSMYDTMLQNKDNIRQDLRDFGTSHGFNTQPSWMEYCLQNWHPDQAVVMEKVRTDEQAITLIAKGFTIVELAIPIEEQVKRAEALGVSAERLREMLQHPLERGISSEHISITLNATSRVYILGDYLALRKDRTYA